MPEQKIIITLSNNDDDPDGVQVHVEAEQPLTDTQAMSDAEFVLNGTTLALTERFIQMLEIESGDG